MKLDVFLVSVLFVTSQFKVLAYKKELTEDQLLSEIKTYIKEANYPEDESKEVIAKDLKITLELDECFVF